MGFRSVLKIAINDYYFRHVGLSVRPQGTTRLSPEGFHNFYISVFFENPLRKFKFHWTLTRITGNLHEYLRTFMIITRSIIPKIRNVSDKSCRENQNTVLCSVTFPRMSCLLRGTVEEYRTARQATEDNIMRCMRFACWITKATNTLKICNTHCFSTATMIPRMPLHVTSYIHGTSCCLRILTILGQIKQGK